MKRYGASEGVVLGTEKQAEAGLPKTAAWSQKDEAELHEELDD